MLLTLPLELLDKIIDFIDDRQDILSLALASHFFMERLIPSVLDYREIVAECDDHRFWSRLSRNPLLARNIRTLTVDLLVDECRLPRISSAELSGSEDDEGSDASVLDALPRMTGLVRLDWHGDNDARIESTGMNPLFTSLYASCPNLITLSIYEAVDAESRGMGLADRNSQLSLLRNLECFCYTLVPIGPRPVVPLAFLIPFLSGHPHLHYLHLDLNDIQFSHYEALAEAHLPHLRTFKFCAYQFPSHIFQSFLSGNKTIEVLEISAYGSDRPIFQGLKEGSAPSLREVTCARGLWRSLCFAKPPLRHLTGLLGGEYGGNWADFQALEVVSETLESVTLSSRGLGATTPVSEVLDWFQSRLPRVEVDVWP
ncbi:hypothetical protein JAAARDRAFT_63549 [Jaapia argillacea MUCL 33604]|uniref:F-box domain-containing protein n=1 Tax=Jaapia argillacea MUCL 33604 TaxID=933084 RepID=A0A067P4I6_9AGAM|nr:hypothetical protein JAAARDRAFT_63549 [Jaapia argillacea MUCL 33604]